MSNVVSDVASTRVMLSKYNRYDFDITNMKTVMLFTVDILLKYPFIIVGEIDLMMTMTPHTK